jgi:hypothetical protein
MTTPVSAIAALIAPLIGRSVIATDKHGAETRYTISKLSDKVGTLKDGSKGEYVILSKDGETGVVINMHPNTAKKLATKGEGDQLKLVPVDGAEQGPRAMDPADQPTSIGGELSTDEQADVKAELEAEQTGDAVAAEAGAAEQTAPVDEAPAEKAPRVSKKSQTLAIFTSMTADGKPRKEIIAKLKADLGLSDACCNTYYQNCKSGAWA